MADPATAIEPAKVGIGQFLYAVERAGMMKLPRGNGTLEGNEVHRLE
jgi:hypothetical protein